MGASNLRFCSLTAGQRLTLRSAGETLSPVRHRAAADLIKNGAQLDSPISSSRLGLQVHPASLRGTEGAQLLQLPSQRPGRGLSRRANTRAFSHRAEYLSGQMADGFVLRWPRSTRYGCQDLMA